MLRRFRSRPPADSGPSLETELRSLEQEARDALPGYEAQFLNRAGDLCLQVGQRARAFRYFGEAVDANLRAHRFDAAAAICRKILRLSPDIVRARCTLAWLSIGKNHQHDARREVSDYVLAARKAGQGTVARAQLRRMAEIVTDPDLKELIASHLREVGDTEGADAVLAEVSHLRTHGLPEPLSPDQRWDRVVESALLGPDELLLGPDVYRGEM